MSKIVRKAEIFNSMLRRASELRFMHHNEQTNTTNTRVFYCQWGIGRIMPSQFASLLNGTLSTSPYNDDYLERLKPQGVCDITQKFSEVIGALNSLTFENAESFGQVLKYVDNNNGGIFVQITTDNYKVKGITYAYMLEYEEGGDYREFCKEATWFRKAGGRFIDKGFKAYYKAITKYFCAREYKECE